MIKIGDNLTILIHERKFNLIDSPPLKQFGRQARVDLKHCARLCVPLQIPSYAPTFQTFVNVFPFITSSLLISVTIPNTVIAVINVVIKLKSDVFLGFRFYPLTVTRE